MSIIAIIDELTLLDLGKSTPTQPVIDAAILDQLHSNKVQEIVLCINHNTSNANTNHYSLSTLKTLLECETSVKVRIMLPGDLIQKYFPGMHYEDVALAEFKQQGNRLSAMQERTLKKVLHYEAIWHVTRTYSTAEILTFTIKKLLSQTSSIFIFSPQETISHLPEDWQSHPQIKLHICHPTPVTGTPFEPPLNETAEKRTRLFQLAIDHQLYEDAVILLKKGINEAQIKSSSSEILEKLLHTFILSLRDGKTTTMLSSIQTLMVFILELDPNLSRQTITFFRDFFIGSIAHSPRKIFHFFQDCYPAWVDQHRIAAYLESEQGQLEMAHLKLAVVKHQFRRFYPANNPIYTDVELDKILKSLTHPIEESWHLPFSRLEALHPNTTKALRESLATLCELSYVPLSLNPDGNTPEHRIPDFDDSFPPNTPASVIWASIHPEKKSDVQQNGSSSKQTCSL